MQVNQVSHQTQTASKVNTPVQFNAIALQVFHKAIETLMGRQEIFATVDPSGIAIAWIVQLQNMYKVFTAEYAVNPNTYVLLSHLESATTAIYGSYEDAQRQSNHGIQGQANMFTQTLYHTASVFIKKTLLITDANSMAANVVIHEDVLNQTILMYERMLFYNGVILCLADQVKHYPHIITHDDINKGLDAFLMFTYSIGEISGNPVVDRAMDEQVVAEDGTSISAEELQIIRGERALTASTLRFIRVLSSVDPQDFTSLIQLTKMVLPAITNSTASSGIASIVSGIVSTAMPNSRPTR